MKHTKLLTAALVTVLLTSCGKPDSKTVMTIGKEKVTYQEYRYYYLNHKRDSAASVDKLKQMTEDSIKYRHTLYILADEYGATVSEDDRNVIEAEIDSYRDSFDDGDAYNAALSEQYLTDSLFRELSADSKLAYAVLSKMIDKGVLDVSDSAYQQAIDSDEIVCYKEIYISTPDASLDDWAKGRAEEAYAKLQSGTEFELLIPEYSNYAASELHVEEGVYAAEYDMTAELWEAVQQLAVGQYSGVIASDYGYHILLRCHKDAAYMSAHRDAIYESFTYTRFYRYFYRRMNELSPIYTDYGQKLDFDNLK